MKTIQDDSIHLNCGLDRDTIHQWSHCIRIQTKMMKMHGFYGPITTTVVVAATVLYVWFSIRSNRNYMQKKYIYEKFQIKTNEKRNYSKYNRIWKMKISIFFFSNQKSLEKMTSEKFNRCKMLLLLNCLISVYCFLPALPTA